MPTLTLPKPHAGQQQVIDGARGEWAVVRVGRLW
jgi:hypothetical protein